ncbi:MAG TPA: hypothetical protein QGF58_02770 [Myxococcota bacterium]|nr:hypothetical protein [Myxococcota bacterium]
MWVLLLECFRGGGDIDSAAPLDTGDTANESGSYCGSFWRIDQLGTRWEYDFVPDEWMEGWNKLEVVREDTYNGAVAWVVYNEGKRDTGSARHRWTKERWYVCDKEGIWLVYGTTTWTTRRDAGRRASDREDYVYTDNLAEPAFLFPAAVHLGDTWESTGTIHHVDVDTGAEISTTSLEGVHEVVSEANKVVPNGTYETLVLESRLPGSADVRTSWLVPGVGLVADDTWLLSFFWE